MSSAHISKLSGDFTESGSHSDSPCESCSPSPCDVPVNRSELLMSRHSRDLLKSLYRAPNPVYATDENNRIIAWNRAAEQLFGLPAADAVGKACHVLIGGTDIYGNDFCDHECNVVKMVRSNRIVKRFDMDVRRASGEVIRVHCAILVVPGPSASRFCTIHLLEEAEEEAPRRKSREAISIPDRPVRLPPFPSASVQLTPREQQVLRKLATGAGTREIADSLFISFTTVRTHIRNILDKMGAHSRLEAVLKAMQHNLI
jgi:PAS domain S-box-containing protein